jgi:hypothetical protein
MIVQYRETDWAFLKRLASRFGTFVSPDSSSSNVRYHIGMPSRKGAPFSPITYSKKTEARLRMVTGENGKPETERKDTHWYETTDREIRRLFEAVEFQGGTYYISRIQSQLKGGALLHSYTIKPLEVLVTDRYENPRLKGVSLDGTVVGVERDKVMVRLSIDAGSAMLNNARWLPYATVYSNPDGTGWFAMPDVGNRVMLNFPSVYEKDCFVSSAFRAETIEELRMDPDKKSMRTKHGKEVEFGPTSLRMTNNKGMTVAIDDEHGITIESDKEILIRTKENLSLVSETDSIYLMAQKGIELANGESRITMGDDIIVTGREIKVQGAENEGVNKAKDRKEDFD